MSSISKIEWTDATWNPIRGCTKVSAGCKNCYAETFAERWRGIPGHPFEQGFDLRLVPEKLQEPRKWKQPKRIFVNSMSDLFHEGVPFEYIDRVFATMFDAGQHTYQILTKRPERAAEYLSSSRYSARKVFELTEGPAGKFDCDIYWPLDNVWIGTSVEDQKAADERIPLLLQCPAAVRFLSCEPLLGPVSLRGSVLSHAALCNPCSPPTYDTWNWLTGFHGIEDHKGYCVGSLRSPKIDWVICGGESGHHARPMHPDWARSLRDQCQAAGVPFFFKQWGQWQIGGDLDEVLNHTGREVIVFNDGRHFDAGSPIDHPAAPFNPKIARNIGKSKAGRLLDGREWNEFPQVKVNAK